MCNLLYFFPTCAYGECSALCFFSLSFVISADDTTGRISRLHFSRHVPNNDFACFFYCRLLGSMPNPFYRFNWHFVGPISFLDLAAATRCSDFRPSLVMIRWSLQRGQYPGVQCELSHSLPASSLDFLCSLPRIPRCHEYTLILLQLVTHSCSRGHRPGTELPRRIFSTADFMTLEMFLNWPVAMLESAIFCTGSCHLIFPSRLFVCARFASFRDDG